MAKKMLEDGDYLTSGQIEGREREARAMRDQDVGIAYLAYAYASPGSNPYTSGYEADPQARATGTTRSQVLSEVSRIYDPQLQVSVARLRDRVMIELFPDGIEWANLEPGDNYDTETIIEADEIKKRLEEREENAAKLEPMQRAVFQDLHRSNFSEQAPDSILDAIIWRVGVLTTRRVPVGEGNSSLSVQHVSQAECAFEWSPHGDCWALYRKHWFSKDEAEFYWPDGSGWTFPEDKTAHGHQPRSTFIEAVYRVHGKMAWAYQVIQERGQEVVRREYRRNPYIVFGFASPAGARLGRSIVELALPAARSLNEQARINTEAAELRSKPSYTVEQGGMPTRQIEQGIGVGELIPVMSNNSGQPSIAPLPVPGDVELGWSSQERLQMQIMKICFDESLPPDRPQPRTATEIYARQREMKNAIGSIFSRLMNRLGRQVLQHFLDALFDLKDIEGMNHEGGEKRAVELDGKEVKVTFKNPLSQAQKMIDVEDVVSGIETLNAIMPPEMVAAALHLEKIPEWMGKMMSWPEEIYRKEAERDPLAQQAVSTQVMGGGGAPASIGPRTPAGGASLMTETPGRMAG